jgi:4'-phosphopantetheinyl transferase
MIVSRLIGLPPDEIHLWLASDHVDRERAIEYRLLLNSDERRQEQRFHFEKDRNRYLVTRALVRTVLSRYQSIDPNAWVFSTNAFGRPEIDAESEGAADLCFNISHTAGLVVVGIARGRALGVDVENIFVRDNPLEVAGQVFAAAELAELGRLPRERRLDRFFQYWTFKESYIKARGMGVSIPLQKFSFRLERDGLVDLEIAPELGDDPKRWQFWQMRPAHEHVLAVCAERTRDTSPAIVVRHATSLDSEQLVPLGFHRVSPSCDHRSSEGSLPV